jgi:hypothetical protein
MWNSNTTSEAGRLGGLTRQQVFRALWLIFVGGLICSISFGIRIFLSSKGRPISRFNTEPLGAVLIALGLWSFAWLDLDQDYKVVIRLVFVVAVLRVVATVADWFPLATDPTFRLVRILFEVLSLVALVAFFRCMQWFCLDTRMRRSARGWRYTTVGAFFYALVAGSLQSIVLFEMLKIVEAQPAPVTSSAAQAWWGLLMVVLLAAPPLAMLGCILRMRGEIERVDAAETRTVVPLGNEDRNGVRAPRPIIGE